MKKLILFIVCVLLGLNLTAQENDSLSRYSITELDSLFKIQKKPDEQLPYALAMLKKGEKEMNVNDTAFAKVLFKVGDTYQKLRDWTNSKNFLEKAIVIWGEKYSDHPRLASCYNSIGNVYYNQGNYEDSKKYWKLSLEIRKKVFGETSPEFASILNNLGILYKRTGEYDLAESMLKQSLEIRKKTLGKLDPDIATTLNNLGNLYVDLGDYTSAEPLLKQALEVRKKNFGEDHPDVAESLNCIGNLYGNKSDYKSAEQYIRQSLEIRKRIFGERHTEVLDCLHDLGALYHEMGDYTKAELLYKQSLEFDDKNFELGNDSKAYNLGNLGALYCDMGDYKSAEPLIKQSMEIHKRVFGENHPDYANSLISFGNLCCEIGDFKTAELVYKQSWEILKKALGEENIEITFCLNNLAVLYWQTGNYKSAEPLYKQALEIVKKALGEEHYMFALMLNNLGVLYYEMQDYKSAEQYQKQALETRIKAFGKENLEVAQTLHNLGNLYHVLGDYKTAESYCKQSMEIYKKSVGDLHSEYIGAKLSFVDILSSTKREKEAYFILNDIFANKVRQIANNFEWLSDNQKEVYWGKESTFYEKLSTFINEYRDKVPEYAGLYYNMILLTKSKMLEAKISSENYYREIDEIREELAQRRRLLSKMESEGSDDLERMNSLKKEAEKLDKRLTLSWPEYAAQKKNLSITWNQVQQKLNSEEAAIEFVRYYDDEDSNYHYNALVLRKSDKNPQLVKLCKERDLTAIQPKAGFSAYYPLIWQPVEKYLEGIKTIYYSPVGEISNIPLHALYPSKSNGDKIIENKGENRGNISKEKGSIAEKDAVFLMDRFKMHRLTSTRYLAIDLKQKENEQIGKSISLSGGINYDFLPGNVENPEKDKKAKIKDRNSELGSSKLSFLEGTLREAEGINSVLSAKGWQSKLLKFNDATEENIIKTEGKEAPAILHLATHGYAFPEFNFMDSSISKNSLRYSFRFSKNPMVRSGIILAGGNWAWTGSDTLTKMGMEQNGILTALEVSQLNLRKTKLVVLSACETGLGKIEGSEGTFGLKRGFKLAGVEQIIVSLWSVPDKETMELMTLFYNDLSLTLNPVISFEKAQKEMRKKYPTEPEKWAGFVLVR